MTTAPGDSIRGGLLGAGEVSAKTNTRNMKSKITNVVDAAVKLFIETGEPFTSSELAERISMSASAVGLALNKSFDLEGGWKRVAPIEVYRKFPISRDYPSMGMKDVKRNGWRVPANHLAEILRNDPRREGSSAKKEAVNRLLRRALIFIALNDEPESDNIEEMRDLISTMLVADTFELDPEFCAEVVVGFRQNSNHRELGEKVLTELQS